MKAKTKINKEQLIIIVLGEYYSFEKTAYTKFINKRRKT